MPEYTVFKLGKEVPTILKSPAQSINFPLSSEDKKDIEILEQKYTEEKNCAGLAAVQIGIPKKIIIFAVQCSDLLKKFRPNCTQSLKKSLWINPSYEGIESAGTHKDFEACFSVADIGGMITRYKKIKYTAYNINGEKFSGTAEGFLARVIQHEIDHTNGILCIDRVKKDDIISIEEYRKKRHSELSSTNISNEGSKNN